MAKGECPGELGKLPQVHPPTEDEFLEIFRYPTHGAINIFLIQVDIPGLKTGFASWVGAPERFITGGGVADLTRLLYLWSWVSRLSDTHPRVRVMGLLNARHQAQGASHAGKFDRQVSGG